MIPPVPTYPTFARPEEVALGALQGACRDQLETLGILPPHVLVLSTPSAVELQLRYVLGAQRAFEIARAREWERLTCAAERHLTILRRRLEMERRAS